MTPLWLAGLLACSSPEGEPVVERSSTSAEPEAPPTARLDTWQAMVADLAAERHPSDGGGRAWLESGDAEVVAGTAGSWVLVYEAGAHGIAAGGALVFQAPAFWGWDTPQTSAPDGPGFTHVEAEAEGVRLVAETVDQQMLRIAVHGRALAPGERVRVHYGAGPRGARADRFAEAGSELWFAVDGDGDGVRELVDEPVRVRVIAGPPARLHLTWPSTARPGERVPVSAAVLDARGNRTAGEGVVRLEGHESLVLPELAIRGGVGRAQVEVPRAGIYALRGSAGPLVGESNPLLVAEGARRVLWGDLQIHTGRSDGTGDPADVWAYAAEVAGLDVAAVTDHDHWGMRFLDRHPELWRESVAAAEAANQPGRFVAIPGFEWTNWRYGHRHVLWFEEPELVSSMDEATDRPDELWAALAGRRAITVAHHSAGAPVAVDWSFRPPPELEPVTEIVSVHGQSESPTTPGAVRQAVQGNFVVDQLRSGLRLGFMGSTDGHDGHPGLAHWNAPSGGLVGIFAEERTRTAVYEALRARRVFATNGVRIFAALDAGEAQMGSVVAPGAVDLELRVLAPTPVLRVEEVRRGGERVLVDDPAAHVVRHTWRLDDFADGDFVYVRVHTADGGLAWTSPIFAGAP